MDHAVALVQAYLRVNGYLTVTEYPVVEATRSGAMQTTTDLDVLAFRFGRASVLGQAAGRRRAKGSSSPLPVDPALDVQPHLPDMIIGEVKEGKAVLNKAATDRTVLEAALSRFGCCDAAQSSAVADELIRRGQAETPHGHRVRLVAFGSTAPDRRSARCQVILLGHVLAFLRAHLRRHWAVIQASETKDPALGFVKLLEKAGADRPAGKGAR